MTTPGIEAQPIATGGQVPYPSSQHAILDHGILAFPWTLICLLRGGPFFPIIAFCTFFLVQSGVHEPCNPILDPNFPCIGLLRHSVSIPTDINPCPPKRMRVSPDLSDAQVRLIRSSPPIKGRVSNRHATGLEKPITINRPSKASKISNILVL